jgi:hypothetical protein
LNNNFSFREALGLRNGGSLSWFAQFEYSFVCERTNAIYKEAGWGGTWRIHHIKNKRIVVTQLVRLFTFISGTLLVQIQTVIIIRIRFIHLFTFISGTLPFCGMLRPCHVGGLRQCHNKDIMKSRQNNFSLMHQQIEGIKCEDLMQDGMMILYVGTSTFLTVCHSVQTQFK